MVDGALYYFVNDVACKDGLIYVDGYYYYNEILQPGKTTPTLFTQVEIVGSKVDLSHVGSTLSLTVNAYAVQSENNPADYPWEASGWPAE